MIHSIFCNRTQIHSQIWQPTRKTGRSTVNDNMDHKNHANVGHCQRTQKTYGPKENFFRHSSDPTTCMYLTTTKIIYRRQKIPQPKLDMISRTLPRPSPASTQDISSNERGSSHHRHHELHSCPKTDEGTTKFYR